MDTQKHSWLGLTRGILSSFGAISQTQRTLLRRYLQTMNLLKTSIHKWRSAKPPTNENQPIIPSPPLHHTSTQSNTADRASQHVPTGAYPEPCIESKAGRRPIMGESLPPSTPKLFLCATPPPNIDPLLPLRPDNKAPGFAQEVHLRRPHGVALRAPLRPGNRQFPLFSGGRIFDDRDVNRTAS